MDKVVTMNYGKLIDNNNVGLKQTLKKILKDVDKRIETSENKECDTTEYETRIQELTTENNALSTAIDELATELDTLTPPDTQLNMDFYIDFNDISFGNQFSGMVTGASNEYLSGGNINLLIPTDNLTGFVVTNSNPRDAVLSNITINNLIINDVEVTINSQVNSSSGDDIAVNLFFSISPSSEHPVSALENNTISVDIVNNNTEYVRTINGTFTIDGTTIGSITTVTNSP